MTIPVPYEKRWEFRHIYKYKCILRWETLSNFQSIMAMELRASNHQMASKELCVVSLHYRPPYQIKIPNNGPLRWPAQYLCGMTFIDILYINIQSNLSWAC